MALGLEKFVIFHLSLLNVQQDLVFEGVSDVLQHVLLLLLKLDFLISELLHESSLDFLRL